jgi:hypothetical protein
MTLKGVLMGMLCTSCASSNAFSNSGAFRRQFDSFGRDPDAPAAGKNGPEKREERSCVKTV